jgi:hypothetical protein
MSENKFHLLLFFLIILLPLEIYSQAEGELLPPHSISIDPATMVLSWNSPGHVVLIENFEEDEFPPSGWQSTSMGKGWQRADTVLLNHWKVPASHSRYAISNDDSSAAGNNGALDLLITPSIDLTGNDSLVLTFDSYFDGAYGQSALVKYSSDGGLTWVVLEELKASLNWEKIIINLSALSGSSGLSNVKFAFHSDDNGYDGSGWAVDNVEIANSPASNKPLNYIIFFDTVPIDTTAGLSTFIPTLEYTYGDEHVAAICACYADGNSDTVSIPLVSKYLFPLSELYTEYCGKYCIGLGWYGPYRPPACRPWELETFFETPDNWIEGGSDAWDDFIYIVYENMNGILMMDKSGNVIDLLIIPGVPPLTDITHDGWGIFYGCNGTNIIYVMDFETLTLTGQFYAPVIAHALAYSEVYEVFYANNISSDITEFNQDGVIKSFPVGAYGNIHSLAFNNADDDDDLYAFSRDSTGALIVGYYAWQGLPSGFLLDVSSLVEGGLAGGVFFDYDGCYDDCVYLGGSIQNEVVFEYALGEQHCPGWTPPGLWGYYIYKDGMLFDSVEIFCDKYLEYVWYPDDTLPQSHEFTASVKYELELFGLDGQNGFSELAGPVQGSISYGYELDFNEAWFSQTFSYHKWDTTGNRWEINTTLGNPPASASFRGISGASPYSAVLTSNMFKPDSLSSCGIVLSFDLRVYDNTPSGNQYMDLELWDSGTREWRLLEQYSNDTVWGGFYHEVIDISDKVMGRHFRIRFNAHGDNPSDIQFWSLDNIMLKHNCLPPGGLLTEFDNESGIITVNWDTPFPEKDQWIYWDDSLHFTSAELGAGPDTWCDVAAKWEPAMLEGYQGVQLEKIAFIPSDPETHYILKVWTGDSAEVTRAKQAVANLSINQWNIINLDDPVKLGDFGDLWIGYSFSAKGQGPVSLDDEPSADGSGNLCRIGNGTWTTLQAVDPGLTGNINIRGFIVQPEKQPEGYRLYKSVDSGPYEFLVDLTDTEYSDVEVEMNLVHCYKAQSICISSPDTLSSGLTAECCVLPVNLAEYPDQYPSLHIYPNPANGLVNIVATELIEQIDLYDITGRPAGSFTGNRNRNIITIDMSSLKPGIYIFITKTPTATNFSKIALTE